MEAPVPEREKPATAPITGDVIAAPMPGKVLKVLVKPGDPVKRGQEVLLLEAMKMENSIQSAYEGVVKQILVGEGDNVAVDAPMIEIGK